MRVPSSNRVRIAVSFDSSCGDDGTLVSHAPPLSHIMGYERLIGENE
jgi:hypothetical protein